MPASDVARFLGDQIFRDQPNQPPTSTDAGGMNLLPQDQRVPPSQWGYDPARLFMPVGDQMPGPGFIPGKLNLNQQIAPQVPQGAARPFAPGEWVDNPGGGWSSEETTTVQGADGRFINIPTLWLKDGKPYVAATPDEALQLAKQSGLRFRAYDSAQEADHAAIHREARWNQMGDPSTWGQTNPAQAIPPLWEQPRPPGQQVADFLQLMDQKFQISEMIKRMRASQQTPEQRDLGRELKGYTPDAQ